MLCQTCLTFIFLRAVLLPPTHSLPPPPPQLHYFEVPNQGCLSDPIMGTLRYHLSWPIRTANSYFNFTGFWSPC